MPITEIASLLPAVNQAVRTATGILQLAKDTKTKQAVIELQTAIFDLHERIHKAQVEQDELTKAKDELERKLKEYERWDSEAARYQLKELADGIFVYVIKPEHQDSEPVYFLCPHCFGERKRSILQRPGAGYTNYICHACKLSINPVPVSMPSPSFGSSRRFTPRRLDG